MNIQLSTTYMSCRTRTLTPFTAPAMHIKDVYGTPLFSLSALPDRGTKKSVIEPAPWDSESLHEGRRLYHCNVFNVFSVFNVSHKKQLYI